MSPRVHAVGSYRRRLPRPNVRVHHATHHGCVMLRNGKVSKALWPTAFACALGMLAAERRDPPTIALYADAAPLLSCSTPAREIRFEMISADVEPAVPASPGPPVCLAVYRLPAPAP